MKLKLVLLDRDGVINRKVIGGYVNSMEDFILESSIFELLQVLESSKIKTAFVTNQQGLGKGLTSYENFFRIHGYFSEMCIEQQVTPPHLFYCPHLEGTCFCRKPKNGMLLAALNTFQVHSSEVLLIGDSITDSIAAKSLSIQSIHLPSTPTEKGSLCRCPADFHMESIENCLELIDSWLM